MNKKEDKNVKTKSTRELKTSKGRSKNASSKKTSTVKKTYNNSDIVIPKQKSQTPIIVVSLLIYLVVVIIPIIFVIIMAYLDLKTVDFEYVGNNIRVGYDEFMITDMKTDYIVNDNDFIISGYITDLDDDLDYIEIIFELYNKDNVVIGEVRANVFDLDDDRTYKFNAIYSEYDAEEVSGYTVKEIYYY